MAERHGLCRLSTSCGHKTARQEDLTKAMGAGTSYCEFASAISHDVYNDFYCDAKLSLVATWSS